MIHYYEYEKAHKQFPKKVQDIVFYGHIGKTIFSEDELKELKEDKLKDLATQKVPYFEVLLDDEPTKYTEETLGLWGEDSPHHTDDLGITCIFLGDGNDSKEFPFPQHFMNSDEIFKFIATVIAEEQPELLI